MEHFNALRLSYKLFIFLFDLFPYRNQGYSLTLSSLLLAFLDFISNDSFLLFFPVSNVHREFASAKVCLKDAVSLHCQFDADAAEILQSAFDDYNPFCNVSSGEEGKRSEPALNRVRKYLNKLRLGRQHGLVVRALDLKSGGPGSVNPPPCHWMNLCSMAPNSTPPRIGIPGIPPASWDF